MILEAEYIQIKAENLRLKTENQELGNKIAILKHELEQIRRMMFGKSSERSKGLYYDNGQMNLFEDEPEADKPEVKKVQVRSHDKVKTRKNPKRNILPAHLPREIETILPEGIDEDEYVKIGEDITEVLVYTPGEFYVKRTIRPRLASKAADNSSEAAVVQASIPPRLIPRGMVDESLIAHLIEEKFLFHTPVYRLAKKYRQAGLGFIDKKNMHNWIHRAAEALMPLYHLLEKDLLQSPYLQGDESTLTVLSSNKPGASHTGYMWLIHNPEDRTTLFHYDPTRQHRVAHELFGNYSGILQADGYEAYESVAKVNQKMGLINCMAHARRKFVEAQNSDPPEVQYYLKEIQKLYQLEKQLREQKADYDTRLSERQKTAVPILDNLKRWMEELLVQNRILPKSPLGKAIAYSLSRWDGLCAYTQDGRLEIDNNLIENEVRPLALGRKNYLFAKNHDTARNIACLYSIILTANKNNLCIQKYLEWLLRKSVTEKITDQAISWLPHKLSQENKEKFKLKEDGV